MNQFLYFAESASNRLISSWPWYLTRASGIVAVILLTLLMITGISMFTGHEFKFMAPLKAWANHRTLGIAFAVSVLVHILSLLFDKFVPFNIWQVFLPFTSSYKRLHFGSLAIGSLGVALGILSLYLLILVIYTSLAKIMSKHQVLWKNTHYVSYAIMVFIFFHSIMIGTDLKSGLWRWIWIGANVFLLGFVALRLRRRGSLDI